MSSCPPCRKSLTLGIAQYATSSTRQEHCPDVDVLVVQEILLEKVKQLMYELHDEVCLETVQTCILQGSFYLYNAQPNLALAILGSGIKSAQAMGLHMESSWKTESDEVREIQRHIWWSLYTFDRYVFSEQRLRLAIVY